MRGEAPGGQNHCPGLILAGRAGQGLYLSLQLQRTDFIRLSLSTKRLCLLHHTGREGITGFVLKHCAGIVFHPVGLGRLPPFGSPLQNQRGKPRSGAVQPGCKARRARAEND